jgi:ribosomal protein L24E
MSSADFDLAALYDAIDAQRQARGLTWTAAVREINAVFDLVPSRPISRSTVVKLKTGRVGEGDGILQMLRWLHRTPESFVSGAAPDAPDTRLPDIPPNRVLRFDTRKLHAALDAARASRGLTWTQVADEIGGMTASTLTHLKAGARTGFPHVMRIVRWLGQPAAAFMRVTLR